MRIRWNSIVTLAVILAALVLVQVIVAVQAPAGQQGGPAAGAQGGAPAGGAAAPGQGGAAEAAVGAADAVANRQLLRVPHRGFPMGSPTLAVTGANPYTNNMARGGSVLDPTKKRADGTCCEPLTWERQGEPLADAKGGAKTFDLPYTEWGRKQWADYDVVANGDYAGSCLPFGWSRNINSPSRRATAPEQRCPRVPVRAEHLAYLGSDQSGFQVAGRPPAYVEWDVCWTMGRRYADHRDEEFQRLHTTGYHRPSPQQGRHVHHHFASDGFQHHSAHRHGSRSQGLHEGLDERANVDDQAGPTTC